MSRDSVAQNNQSQRNLGGRSTFAQRVEDNGVEAIAALDRAIDAAVVAKNELRDAMFRVSGARRVA